MISIRVDAEDKAILLAKAKALGITLSKYVRVKLELEESQ